MTIVDARAWKWVGPVCLQGLLFPGCVGRKPGTVPVAVPVEVGAVPVEVESQTLHVPAAPLECTAAYVLSASTYPFDAPPTAFRQFPGEVDGLEWGACQWMGPTPADGGYLWVFLVWEPGWQGQLSCELDGVRSPVLEVGPSTRPADEGIKVKWYRAPPELEVGSIPTMVAPCAVSPPLE